jgi:hypothetical protein
MELRTDHIASKPRPIHFRRHPDELGRCGNKPRSQFAIEPRYVDCPGCLAGLAADARAGIKVPPVAR